MKRILELASWFFIISGFGGLLAGYASSIINLPILEELEFPLANIKGIAQGKNNSLYSYSQYYGRLQLFDNRGNFVRNWQFNKKDTSRIWMDTNYQLHLAKNVILDTNKGTILNNTNSTRVREYLPPVNYRLRNPLFFPEIVKSQRGTKDTVFIKSKYFAFFIFIIGLIPAIIVSIIGLIMSKISEKLNK